MVVRVLSSSIAVQGSAGEHDAGEHEIRLAIPTRRKWNRSHAIFHTRIFAEWLVIGEELERE